MSGITLSHFGRVVKLGKSLFRKGLPGAARVYHNETLIVSASVIKMMDETLVSIRNNIRK